MAINADASDVCRIHLVRHGTTLLNRQNRYRGRIDVPLDEGGWRDAWTAADELKEVGLAACYASPLRRARDTARIIADVAGLGHVLDLPGLLNLDYGRWEGKTADEARAADPEAYAAYQTHAEGAECPGGENLDRAAERVLLSLRTLALLHPGQTVAAVSHAAMVRLGVTLCAGLPREEWRRSLPNGSVTVFEATGSEVHLVSIPSSVAVLD